MQVVVVVSCLLSNSSCTKLSLSLSLSLSNAYANTHMHTHYALLFIPVIILAATHSVTPYISKLVLSKVSEVCSQKCMSLHVLIW